MEGVHSAEPLEAKKQDYTVRRHEPSKQTSSFSTLNSAGAASTTKKIMQNSIDARKKMANLDSEINRL